MKKKPPAPDAAAKTPAPPAKKAASPAPAATSAPKTTSAGVDAEKSGTDFGSTPAVSPSTAPSLTLDPTLRLGLPTLGVGPMPSPETLPPGFFKLSDSPSLIDWSRMRAPFLNHGLHLGTGDVDTIEQGWGYTFGMMRSWGLSVDMAASLANIGIPFMYDAELARSNPNAEDRLEADIAKSLAPGKYSKIVVPIITPDSLSWVTQKITGKKVDFHF